MKKYFLGLSSIFLAITFSAFITKPFTGEELFRIKSSVDKTNEFACELVTNWERIPITSAACYSNNTDDQVCEIYVSDTYWSTDANGKKILNATDPDGAGPDLPMTINAAPGLGTNQIVVATGSTIVSRHNKDLP